MMAHEKRRSCPRNTFEAPILISDKLDGDYFNAMMHNHSKNGMYLVSSQPIGSDSGLYINLLDPFGPDVYKGFFGRVKWCRELKRSSDQNEHFGIGLNFVIKSHQFFGGISYMTDCSCDICGERASFEKLIRTNDFIMQCKKCHDSLNGYPEGSLKSCINSYLIGNIL